MNQLRFHHACTVYDAQRDVFYIPFVARDGRVGYKVGRTDDRPDAETFIYMNPSVGGSSRTPDVFIYVGTENDPAHDDSQVYIDITREDFGIEDDDS